MTYRIFTMTRQELEVLALEMIEALEALEAQQPIPTDTWARVRTLIAKGKETECTK